MSERTTQERLTEIRVSLGNGLYDSLVADDDIRALLVELDAVTADRDAMRTAGNTRRPLLAVDDESRMRAEVAAWKLSEQHENCMPIDTCDKERLLREVDGLRAELAGLRPLSRAAAFEIVESELPAGCVVTRLPEPAPGRWRVGDYKRQAYGKKLIETVDALKAEKQEWTGG